MSDSHSSLFCICILKIFRFNLFRNIDIWSSLSPLHPCVYLRGRCLLNLIARRHPSLFLSSTVLVVTSRSHFSLSHVVSMTQIFDSNGWMVMCLLFVK